MNGKTTVGAVCVGILLFSPVLTEAAPKNTANCGTDRNNPSQSDLQQNLMQHGIRMVTANSAPAMPYESCRWRKQAFQLQSQRTFKLRHHAFPHISFAMREESYGSAEAAANRVAQCHAMPTQATEDTKVLIEMRECMRIGSKVYLVSTDDSLGLSHLPNFAAEIKKILQYMKPQVTKPLSCASDSRPIMVRTNRNKQDIVVNFFKKKGFKIANNRAPPALLPENCGWLQGQYGLRARRFFKTRSERMTTVPGNGELRQEYMRLVISEEVYSLQKQAIRRAAMCNRGRALRGLYGDAALFRTCFVVGNRVYTLANEGIGLDERRLQLASELREALRGK